MKIIIAPNSFKGTLSAPEAARAMASGMRKSLPDAELLIMPLADGGEGTAQTLATATEGRLLPVSVTDSLGTPVSAHFALLGPDLQTAVVEMAQAAGLSQIPQPRRNPRRASSFGVGQMLKAATQRQIHFLYVGLGGSATNDAGAGAMAALGARFLDKYGKELPSGGAALARLAQIDLHNFHFPNLCITVTAIADVDNPLTGRHGASVVYGPQKGADPDMVSELDSALAHYAEIIRQELGKDIEFIPGAGAGGGLGAALAAFLDAKICSGIETVLDIYNFNQIAEGADWVLTGEGRIDEQTLFGKTIHGLLARCRPRNIPVAAFAGYIEVSAVQKLRKLGLRSAISLVSDTVTEEMALRKPFKTLEMAVAAWAKALTAR